MAEPFVFHFNRGPRGPEALYMADVRAECGLCGHLQLQRFYHSTELHTATVRRFRELTADAHAKTAFDCPQCGTEVGPEHCVASTATWGFADDSGLIVGFHAPGSGLSRYQFVMGRRLDPQSMPVFGPDDGAVTFDHIDEELVESQIGRPFNAKVVWNEVLSDWAADPEGGALVEVSAGYYFGVDRTEAEGELLAESLVSANADLVQLPLLGVPDGLATHDEPARLLGNAHTFLSTENQTALRSGHAFALVDMGLVRFHLERAFELARLTYVYEDETYRGIAPEGGVPFPRDLPLIAVAKRAVYTGLTPGDAARLTAEEITGLSLRVWK